MNQHRSNWPRGKLLGGSSSINYMLFVRGHQEDYDLWGRLTNSPLWQYKSCLPFFSKLESISPPIPVSPHRGTNGPVTVSILSDPNATSAAFIEACHQVGIPSTEDYNDGKLFGACRAQINTKNGQRCSTADAYLKDAIKRPNLT